MACLFSFSLLGKCSFRSEIFIQADKSACCFHFNTFCACLTIIQSILIARFATAFSVSQNGISQFLSFYLHCLLKAKQNLWYYWCILQCIGGHVNRNDLVDFVDHLWFVVCFNLRLLLWHLIKRSIRNKETGLY